MKRDKTKTTKETNPNDEIKNVVIVVTVKLFCY